MRLERSSVCTVRSMSYTQTRKDDRVVLVNVAVECGKQAQMHETYQKNKNEKNEEILRRKGLDD